MVDYEAKSKVLVRKMKKFNATKARSYRDPDFPAASPSVQYGGRGGDVLDVAAVNAGTKPAAIIHYGSDIQPARGSSAPYYSHLITAGMKKGRVLSPPRDDASHYYGKRKNVHKLMRMDRFMAENPGAWGHPGYSAQVGHTLGYPKVKTDAFNRRSKTLRYRFNSPSQRITPPEDRGGSGQRRPWKFRMGPLSKRGDFPKVSRFDTVQQSKMPRKLPESTREELTRALLEGFISRALKRPYQW